MKTKETTITENQFWQLVGLVTASKSLRRQEEALETAYKNITGEGEINRYVDYVYEDRDIIESLKEHLPFDKIIVKWNKPTTLQEVSEN